MDSCSCVGGFMFMFFENMRMFFGKHEDVLCGRRPCSGLCPVFGFFPLRVYSCFVVFCVWRISFCSVLLLCIFLLFVYVCFLVVCVLSVSVVAGFFAKKVVSGFGW